MTAPIPPIELQARAALAQAATEPAFTDEEVELHSAPWSYLEPPLGHTAP